MKSNIFKFMSVVTYACFMFTLFEIGAFFTLGVSFGYIGMTAIVLSSILGLQISLILGKRSSSGIMMATVIISSGIISVASMFLLGLTYLASTIFFVACAIVSIHAYKACNKTLIKTISKKKLIIYLLMMAGLFGYVSLFTDLVFLSKEFVLTFGISTVFSMYILNRSMLEFLYAKKSSDVSSVNSVIQKYNFHFITGFAAILVLLLYGKDLLASIMKALGLYAMLGLVKLITPGGAGGGIIVPVPSEIIEPITTGTPPPPPPPGPPILNIIAMIFAALIVTVVLVIVLRILVLRAPGKLRLVWGKLRAFFLIMLGLSDEKVKAEGIDYIDELSNIDKDELSYDKHHKLYQNYKKVSHIKDPVERMRAFYAYFMTSLKKNNVPLYAYDTSYDIYGKTHLVSDNEEKARSITEIYNVVRYGDIIPNDKMLAYMDEYVSGITKTFKEIKEDKKKGDKTKKRII